MQKWLKITWFYFSLLAFVGLLLRAFPFVSIGAYFDYRNLVHAHSHIAILAWLYNALFLLFYQLYLKGKVQKNKTKLKRLIQLYQLVVVLMFIAFVIQGYGLYSILFSSLQMLLTFLLLYEVYRAKIIRNLAIHYSSIFLVFSSLLPLFLGMVKALKVDDSLTEIIVNNYLYFQISGFVYFALIALVIKCFSMRLDAILNKWLTILFLTVIGSALIALKWVDSHLLKFLIFSFSTIQILAIWKIFKDYIKQHTFIKYLFLVFISKTAIQFVFLLPDSIYWLSNRFMVISYLHYLLLFVFSFTFWKLFIRLDWIANSRLFTLLYLIGAAGTVGLLAAMGFGIIMPNYQQLLLLFAALLFLAIFFTKITLKV